MDCFLLSVRSVALGTTTKVSRRGGISNLDLAVERGNEVMSSPREGGRVARQHVNDLQKSMIRALRGLRELPAVFQPSSCAYQMKAHLRFEASIHSLLLPSSISVSHHIIDQCHEWIGGHHFPVATPINAYLIPASAHPWRSFTFSSTATAEEYLARHSELRLSETLLQRAHFPSHA